MLYSPSTNGFYSIDSTNPPSDLIEINPGVYESLITGQEQGKEIVPGDLGFPELREPNSDFLYPRFTALQMLDLFTEEEQLAVVEATMANPEVKLWYDRMMAATFVTYEDGRVEEGLAALVQAGLLTEQRKAEIVAAMQPGQ